MTEQKKCPFPRLREYPDCYEDCPDIVVCPMIKSVTEQDKEEIKKGLKEISEGKVVPLNQLEQDKGLLVPEEVEAVRQKHQFISQIPYGILEKYLEAQHQKDEQKIEEAKGEERERIGGLIFFDTNDGEMPLSLGLSTVLIEPYKQALKGEQNSEGVADGTPNT